MREATSYDQDFLQWTQQQADYLRQGYWVGLDADNLIEELEALGRSDRRTRREAAKETRKPLASFPERCPYRLEQILDSNFLP